MQRTTLLYAILIAALATPALADGDYVTGYVGGYDVMDDKTSAEFGVEYRAKEFSYHVQPMAGVFANSDGGAYVYGGFNWNVPVTDNIRLSPNFAVGLYHEGDSKDLGGALNFRSGLELSYQMQNAHRVGVAFNHISNASIYDSNPGTESLVATYSVPMSNLLK